MMSNEVIQTILYAVITAVIPIISTYLVKYLNNLRDKIDTEIEEMIFKDTVDNVLEVIVSTVNCTTQTYVDALKKEGKFDKEAQDIAFKTTKEKILLLLSEEVIEVLDTLYQNAENWIDIQIENAVKMYK